MRIAEAGGTLEVSANPDDKNAVANCQKLISHVVPSFTKLAQSLSPMRANHLRKRSPLQVTALKVDACAGRQRDEAMEHILAALDEHGDQIGLLLPAGPGFQLSNAALLAGVEAAVEAAGGDFKKRVIVRTVPPDVASAERVLAEWVFGDRVAIVMGGVHKAHAQALAKWADEVYLPVLMLSGNTAIAVPLAQGFRVFPTQARLASVLTRGLEARGVRRVAFMRPGDGSADALFAALRKSMAAANMQILGEVGYVRDDGPSLADAAAKLAQLDLVGPAGRGDYARASAVVFPDHFRAVRHFVRALEFQGLAQVLVVGDQQWRSPALVRPEEALLDGALFADFIGNYQNVPLPLRRRLHSSASDFLGPEEAAQTDFAIIGYRAGDLAMRALEKEEARREIASTLRTLPNPTDGFFPAGGRAFDDHRVSVWPVFLFRVKGTHIQDVTPR